MQVARTKEITEELPVVAGSLTLDRDFAVQAEDGTFLNFIEVNYPAGFTRKHWSIEFREDGLYLHTSSSVLNGKVDGPIKAQFCLELIRGSLTWNSSLRLVARICRGDIVAICTTMEILKNAGLIESFNRDKQ